MTAKSFISALCLIICYSVSCFAKNLAWNGHTLPGSTTPARLTPYYVPPGAKSYGPSSKFVYFKGSWTRHKLDSSATGVVHQTDEAEATVGMVFTGTGVEVFGSRGLQYGTSHVFVDGVHIRDVDAWMDSPTVLRQQRLFWFYNLPYGKHHLKIVNSHWKPGTKGWLADVDAFVVSNTQHLHTESAEPDHRPAFNNLASASGESENPVAGKWQLVGRGSTGVHAMQLAIISSTHAIIIDKVEHNPLTIDGHPAWGALYDLNTDAVTPLSIKSNSFCAGGAFLGNGTLVNVGGNPVVEDYTAAADFGDEDGLQSVRLFDPCLSKNVEGCKVYENHDRIRMASPRWYPTVVRITDGSVIIIGGSKKGGWINNATVNNPSVEFFPPKSHHGSHGLPIHMPFLEDTLNSNLFPIAFLLPDGKLFVAANNDAMIYDWEQNKERRLPSLPNGVRVTYPMTGSGLLLPLSSENNYSPEVLICGGSTLNDTEASWDISARDPASKQCSRMVLNDDGISRGWQVEYMPWARTMLDMVILPTGQIVIVNGAASGISGYGNVRDQVGASNADNPVLKPVLYDPYAEPGKRFLSAGMPESQIPRLYHSVATLTPAGDVMITGSNPNLDRSEMKYGTEYRVEWLRPPYMDMHRPEIVHAPGKIEFGETVKVQIKSRTDIKVEAVKAALMEFGYVTHGNHANSRLLYLLVTKMEADTVTLTLPKNENLYPRGPGWLIILVDDVPTKAARVMVGDGRDPPVDRSAQENVLKA